MAKVTYVFEDDPEGGVDITAEYDPPFDKREDPTVSQALGFLVAEALVQAGAAGAAITADGEEIQLG